MADSPFHRPTSPPPISPLRPTTAKGIPSPLRCLTPTRSPVPAIQSPSYIRGTGPPPFNFDARERLLSILTLTWVHALIRPAATGGPAPDSSSGGYSDELMYRLWLSCDGLVDTLLVRLTRFRTHPPFESFDALVSELTTQPDSRRLPALQSTTTKGDEKAVGSDTALSWTTRPLSKSFTSLVSTAPVQTTGWEEEDDPIAAALGVQSPRLSRTVTLPVLPYASATLSRSPSASPNFSYSSFSPSMSPSFGCSISMLDSPTPSPPSRPTLPFLVGGVSLSPCPPLTRSVSAQSGMAVEAGRPGSRQLKRLCTRSDILLDSMSPEDVLPRRLQQPQVSMVREEDES